MSNSGLHTDEPIPAGQRQDVPGVEPALAPLRQAFDSLNEAQRQSQVALEALLKHLETVITSTPNQPAPVTEPAAPVPAESPASEPVPVTFPELTAPAPVTPFAPPGSSTMTEALVGPRPGGSGAETRRQVRRTLTDTHRLLSQIDRITDEDALVERLWELARKRGLRTMLLFDKGRVIQAERAAGFENFEGSKQNRLKKVSVRYEADGLFAALVAERAVYSGPRPVRGLPVDLVLVMGKRTPAWCLLIPLPYRNRWGRFMYVDAQASQLEGILFLDTLARYTVMQLRASRTHQHKPADKVRGFMELALRDRKKKLARSKPSAPPQPAQESPDALVVTAETSLAAPVVPDLLAPAELEALTVEPEPDIPPPPAPRVGKLPVIPDVVSGGPESPSTWEPPRPDRFGENGELLRPLMPQEILNRIGQLPTMPHVAGRVLEMLNDPEATVASLQEAIGTDQALSVRLLQIANSSLYGSMRNCNTISEAVVRLGFTAIRSWLMATVTRSAFLKDGAAPELHALWQQSVVSGMAAQMVAEQTGRLNPELAFLGGLMQNIGLLLLARNRPEVFSHINAVASHNQVPYFEVERSLLGFDHADMGAIILERWGLGENLVSAVAAHHRLESAGSAETFATIIAMGEEIAMRLASGPTEAVEADLADSEIAQRLGLDSMVLADLNERLGRMMLDRSLVG